MTKAVIAGPVRAEAIPWTPRGVQGIVSSTRIEDTTSTAPCFATLYRAWERSTDENTNGLVRQPTPRQECAAGRTTPAAAHRRGQGIERPGSTMAGAWNAAQAVSASRSPSHSFRGLLRRRSNEPLLQRRKIRPRSR